MRLGFFTACLPEMDLAALIHWAADEGFDALEVAAWPSWDERPHAVTHVAADRPGDRQVEEVRALFADTGVHLSSLGFYGNNLDADPARRAEANAHVRACVDAAAALGCPTVGTFVGRDITRSVADNLAMAGDVLAPLVEHARDRGVHLVVENCLMPSWHPDGYPANLAYSPELWEWMFSLGLELNFDPSHLVPIGIDPLAALLPYAHRVRHVQAKDVQLFPERRDRYGFYGPVTSQETELRGGWWRYRVPGRGDVDWRGLVGVLEEAGYNGAVSVEHEDPVWSGDEQRVKAGLRIAHRTLRPLIVA